MTMQKMQCYTNLVAMDKSFVKSIFLATLFPFRILLSTDGTGTWILVPIGVP